MTSYRNDIRMQETVVTLKYEPTPLIFLDGIDWLHNTTPLDARSSTTRFELRVKPENTGGGLDIINKVWGRDTLQKLFSYILDNIGIIKDDLGTSYKISSEEVTHSKVCQEVFKSKVASVVPIKEMAQKVGGMKLVFWIPPEIKIEEKDGSYVISEEVSNG